MIEAVEQERKLRQLGATAEEVAEFFALFPTEDDWLYVCLMLIRQDRRGVFAVQKKDRSDLQPLWAKENVAKGAKVGAP